jgi:hypothetical protein
MLTDILASHIIQTGRLRFFRKSDREYASPTESALRMSSKPGNASDMDSVTRIQENLLLQILKPEIEYESGRGILPRQCGWHRGQIYARPGNY